MDDCNLEKLSIKPGKLKPAFKMDVLEYTSTVGSNVENINFDCLTRDTGASYSISVRNQYRQGRFLNVTSPLHQIKHLVPKTYQLFQRFKMYLIVQKGSATYVWMFIFKQSIGFRHVSSIIAHKVYICDEPCLYKVGMGRVTRGPVEIFKPRGWNLTPGPRGITLENGWKSKYIAELSKI